MNRKITFLALGAWWGCWANNFSSVSAASANEPMPNPRPPKKWRLVISSRSLRSNDTGLLLCKRFIQIREDIGDHRPGGAVRGVARDLSGLIRMDGEVLALAFQPVQNAIRLAGLRKAAGHQTKSVGDTRRVDVAAFTQDPY